MNKTKKFLIATLTVLTAGLCMIGVTGCGGSGDGEKQKCEEHTIAEWYYDFSAGEKGCETAVVRGTCTVCYETVVKTGAEHDLDESTLTTHEVTCEEDGYDEAVCRACGHTVKTNIAEALGHDEKEVVVEPTCTTDGYTEHGCTRCGLVKDNFKPMSGHNIEDGECTYCEKKESEGLMFEEIDGEYWVKWGGTCTDEDLIIPAMHEDKPGVGIKWGTFSSANGNPNDANPFNLKHLTIPASVRVIEESAFEYCYNLETVVFLSDGNGTVTLGRRVFAGCTSLKTVKLTDRITEIPYEAFAYCKALTEITIPANVTAIGEGAFQYCENLASVTFNDGLQTIEYNAFYECYDLMEVVLPESVTDIGDSAFSSCGSLTSVTMGHNVKTIGAAAFNSCRELTDISIPESVTKVGRNAFSGGKLAFVYADGLTYFDGWLLSGDASWSDSYEIAEGTVGIADYAFYPGAFESNTTLTSVTIPNTVKVIGEYAFSDCDGLTGLRIPSSVKVIHRMAFRDCDGLTSLEIPSSVKLIDEYAFFGCDGLTSVTIGDTTIPSGASRSVVIGEKAFSSCENLTKVTIRNTVKSIGQRALDSCEKLEMVEYTGTLEEWNDVEKGAYWLANTLVTEIKCAGGFLGNIA